MESQNRFSYNDVKYFIEKELDCGFVLLSTYYKSANNTKLDIMCPKGHIFHATLNELKAGRGCSVCHESSGETKIRYYLEYIFPKVYEHLL